MSSPFTTWGRAAACSHRDALRHRHRPAADAARSAAGCPPERRSSCSARRPAPSTPPTAAAWSTATSSRATCWSSGATTAPTPSTCTWPTSASPSTWAGGPAPPPPARSSAPSTTSPPSRSAGISLLGLADQYSLGCVLYECLTGRVPFEKDLDAAIIWAHVEESPTQPTMLRPDLPPAIDAVFARALAKNPGDRYETCRDFMTAAREALGPMAEPLTASDTLQGAAARRSWPPAPPSAGPVRQPARQRWSRQRCSGPGAALGGLAAASPAAGPRLAWPGAGAAASMGWAASRALPGRAARSRARRHPATRPGRGRPRTRATRTGATGGPTAAWPVSSPVPQRRPARPRVQRADGPGSAGTGGSGGRGDAARGSAAGRPGGATARPAGSCAALALVPGGRGVGRGDARPERRQGHAAGGGTQSLAAGTSTNSASTSSALPSGQHRARRRRPTVAGKVAVGQNPSYIQVAPNGKFAYIARSGRGRGHRAQHGHDRGPGDRHASPRAAASAKPDRLVSVYNTRGQRIVMRSWTPLRGSVTATVRWTTSPRRPVDGEPAGFLYVPDGSMHRDQPARNERPRGRV